jgi:GT2 family glycosyltransferase
MSRNPRVSVSVVSHGQGALVRALLDDLAAHVKTPVEVLLTLNVPETLPFDTRGFPFPVRLRNNAQPKGFGANHNAAFGDSHGQFFCVLNPDIRLGEDPFPALLACLEEPHAGLAAPVIRNSTGALEDSARRFPTPWFILKKALTGASGADYRFMREPIHPDWVAGMFMIFPREVFAALQGFDERYFLYYEDVDLCARLALAGRRVVLCPAASAVHEARRQSRSSVRYLRWHLASMLRFFLSAPAFRLALKTLRGRSGDSG